MGLFGLFSGNIILIGVAFFVYIAASSEAQQVTMKAAFQDVTVGDIMTPANDRPHHRRARDNGRGADPADVHRAPHRLSGRRYERVRGGSDSSAS